MKVLALNGSPRQRNSATYHLLEALLTGMQDAGAETQIIHLKDLNLQQCIGCYSCWVRTPGVCIHSDGMAAAMEAMAESDLVVFGTPLYHYSMTGLMKIFFDRLLPEAEPWLIEDSRRPGLTTHPHRRSGGPTRAMLVSPCGFPEAAHFGPLVATFRYIAERHGWEWMGELLRPGAEALSKSALAPLFADYMADVRLAGAALIREGRIPEALATALARDLFPGGRERFQQEANKHWQTLYEGRGSSSADALSEDEMDMPSTGMLSCKEIIASMPRGFNPDAAQGMRACIEFRLSGAEPGIYHLSIADEACAFAEGPAPEAGLTIEAPSEVWKEIASGKRDGRVEMMKGAYRTKGDFALLLKMEELFKQNNRTESESSSAKKEVSAETKAGSGALVKGSASFSRELLGSVVLPVGIFAAVKHTLGTSATVAVAAGVIPALLFALYAWVVEKRKSFMSMISVAALVLVLLGTLAARQLGSPLLIKLAYVPVTLCLGLAFCISVAIRRPLTMYLPRPGETQAISPENRENIRHSPRVLRGYTVAATFWGVGLLLVAAKEAVLAVTLPLDMFMYLNPVTTYGALALLAVGTPILARKQFSRQ